MQKIIEQRTGIHRNNFDFLRMCAAIMVLISHHFALTGQSEPSFYGIQSLGGIGVLIFFSISGFLVTQSWLSDPSLLRFAIRRALRIWPALAVVTTLTAVVLGPSVSSLSVYEYFSNKSTWHYFDILLLKTYYILPGVFDNNPYPKSVNGSLWTIPIEVKCYFVLACAGILRLLRMRTTISVFALISIFWIFGIKHPEVQATRNYGFEFSAFFLSGAALAFYGDFLKSRPWRLLSAVLILSTISWLLQYRYLAIALTLPLGIICFGLASSPFVRKAGLLGDVSYGMYLYAFPIQQLVVMLWLPTVGFSATLIISLAITWALSLVSWHFVEKHALRLKPTIKQSGLVGPKSQSITPVSGRDVI